MAKQKMFCVFDVKVGAYAQPFFMRTAGEALRSWEEACNDSQSMMCKHPADYTLFEVGEFDDNSGRVATYEVLKPLSTAIEVKRAAPEAQPGLPFGQAQGGQRRPTAAV